GRQGLPGGGGDLYRVAYPAAADDGGIQCFFQNFAGQAVDHGSFPRNSKGGHGAYRGCVPIRRLRLQWQWAMAMPRASAVSSGLGIASRCSIRRVISWICFLTALPYPVMACLTCMGVYS